MRTTLHVALLALALVTGTASGATIAGPARVVDGDGLKIGPVAIRLYRKIISCPGGSFGMRAV